MAVGVGKVEAAPAATGVDLAVRRRIGPTAVLDTVRFQPTKDFVKLRVCDQKRVVVTLKAVAIVPVEAQVRIDVHLGEVADRSAVAQPEDVGKEFGRAFLVSRRHDGVVERDRHWPIIPPRASELNQWARLRCAYLEAAGSSTSWRRPPVISSICSPSSTATGSRRRDSSAARGRLIKTQDGCVRSPAGTGQLNGYGQAGSTCEIGSTMVSPVPAPSCALPMTSTGRVP